MIVLQQMTTVWFLKNMGGITMKKRIKSIGMTAGLLAVLAGCSAVQTDTDYMELRHVVGRMSQYRREPAACRGC